MRFFTKLMILTFTIIIITGLLIFYFVYTSNLRTLEAEIKDRLENEAFHAIDKIDRVLYERRADIQMIATDPIISSRDSTPRQITKRLIEFRNIYKTYISLSFFDLNRIRIADTAGLDIGKQCPIEIYWKDLLERKISAGSEISVSKSLKIPVIHFASPVKDKDENTFGFVAARVPLGKLQEIIRQVTGIHEPEKEFEIDLVDKNGLLLYSNYNKKGILKDNYRELEPVKRSMAGEKIGSLIQACPLLKREKDICAFVHEQGYLDFKGNDWTLLIHIKAETVFAPAFELKKKIIVILLLILTGTGIVVYFITKIITKPIGELSDAVTKVGKGELGTKIAIETKDEIGQLSRAFDEMVKDLEKTTTSIANLNKEINERKKAQEALKDYARQIEEVNKELDDFTYIVSHDLKEPLRSINAFSKFIVEDYKDKLDGEGRNYLARIRANVSRMQNLIEDLLEISRIERRKKALEGVEVEEVINEVKLRLEYVIKEKNAEIIVQDKLPSIFCDRVRLTEVFINLISNAIKFTDKQKPIIEIGCSEKGAFYEFYVKDNGPGIEERYFDKIFEIFQKLERREDHEGTGAGLTIAKKIVEMHKGKIWVESKIGQGSIFYFTIPKEKEVILGKKKIGEILIEKKLITEAELKKALEEQKGMG